MDMNIVEQISRYYLAAKALVNLYQLMVFDQDSKELLDQAMKYVDKATELKKQLDTAHPELEGEILNIADEIKKGKTDG